MAVKKSKLNLGCGRDVKPGYINLDFRKTKGVDVVHDLEKIPYPFPDNSFTEVLAYNVVEHVENFIALVKEIYRILKPGGSLKIITPHFSSYGVWSDPTHRRGFAYDTFSYFSGSESNFHKLREQEHYFKDFRFSKIKRKLLFSKGLHVWNYIVEPLANLFPYVYEHTGIRNIFPAENIYVELIK
ncbi:class I SAM-dependent methyltransferase [Candidatus Woesearchaeota archaeon]|nr:class I SAM-dependent methyltransferase [Candidatus Woesearchaeota archaeon]